MNSSVSNKKIMLCCDLDRTVIPNGYEKEPPYARKLFRKLAEQPDVTLVYVTGRHKALIEKAIKDYDLPIPDFALSDVGSTIYRIHNNTWVIDNEWIKAISPDWQGRSRLELLELIGHLPDLRLQEQEKQNTFKLSFYASKNINCTRIIENIQASFRAKNILASIIWSVDDITGQGLLDILPRSANKLHAIRFLMEQESIKESETIFAGDSGNDMDVLTSSINSVLVGNATESVKQDALNRSRELGNEEKLYMAHENYASGIVEGVLYYLPELKKLIE